MQIGTIKIYQRFEKNQHHKNEASYSPKKRTPEATKLKEDRTYTIYRCNSYCQHVLGDNTSIRQEQDSMKKKQFEILEKQKQFNKCAVQYAGHSRR